MGLERRDTRPRALSTQQLEDRVGGQPPEAQEDHGVRDMAWSPGGSSTRLGKALRPACLVSGTSGLHTVLPLV